jgi:hypothetical protein
LKKNNPRFFAGHVGVGGDDVDAGLAQRPKYRSQFIFSHGEVAIDYDRQNAAQVFTPIVLSRSTLLSEGELDHSLFGDKQPVGNMILR